MVVACSPEIVGEVSIPSLERVMHVYRNSGWELISRPMDLAAECLESAVELMCLEVQSTLEDGFLRTDERAKRN
jgi:hypothetical protein